MRRTIRPIKHIAKHVVAWMFCLIGLGILHHNTAIAQHALPPLYPVNVSNFTIPFEVGESANSIRELELLVSRDRGRRWHSVARQPIETGKFPFHADSDGEYWFAFRRVSGNGNQTSFNGSVQLRVLVDTQNSAAAIPDLYLQPSKPEPVLSGPITPPRPERFHPGRAMLSPTVDDKPPMMDDRKPTADTTQAPTLSMLTPSEKEEEEPEQVSEEEPVQTSEALPLAFGPRFPGFESSETSKERESSLLDDLLNGMRPFMDVQPVLTGPVFPQQTVPVDLVALRAAPAVPADAVPTPSVDIAVGGITGINLNHTELGSQIVVNWNSGQDRWRDAQIDVLRGSTQEGPWIPIAINLPNSGGYWWFLTPEDLKPFHVTVRIRSLHGGIREDVTQLPIMIDPDTVSSKLAQFQR